MLATLTAQAVLVLFSGDEDGLYAGPFASVDYERAHEVAEWHEAAFNVLLVLIALHVAAITVYLVFRRRNLIGPMLTGRAKPLGEEAGMVPAPALRFLLAGGIAGVLTAWLFAL
jgi:cytochrome b